MDNKNNKNKLQEIFQKKQLSLPKYISQRINDKFVSSVSVEYNQTVYQCSGEAMSKKTDAEISAASEMLQIITNIQAEQIILHKLDGRITILIDIENIHIGNFFENNKFTNNYEFIGFATDDHPAINLIPKDLIKIETIKSNQKDAADILMIGYLAHTLISQVLTRQLITKEMEKIIIVTKDHFGNGLVDYVHKYYPEMKCVAVKSMEELLTQL